MNVIKHKWVFLSLSGLLVAASIFGLIAFGLARGIDFTGGTLWQVTFQNPVERATLTEFLQKDLAIPEAVVTPQTERGSFLIKAKELSETKHQEAARELRGQFGTMTELSFQSIGAAIGHELVTRAIWAFIINLFAISLYIAYAFRKVSYPVNSWKYSLITLLTLFHDAIIPVGLFTFLGYFLGIEIDTNFIVAVLVVIGFSVHDTIVVFDRIRENLRISDSSKTNFGELVNRSINETFARSFNTSLTLFIVLVTLFVLGGATLQYFVLAILVGTIVGTYSSIFVASPLLVLWNKNTGKTK